jgi:hypothetical protein
MSTILLAPRQRGRYTTGLKLCTLIDGGLSSVAIEVAARCGKCKITVCISAVLDFQRKTTVWQFSTLEFRRETTGWPFSTLDSQCNNAMALVSTAFDSGLYHMNTTFSPFDKFLGIPWHTKTMVHKLCMYTRSTNLMVYGGLRRIY